MAEAAGFEYIVRKNGDINIFHHGRRATTLRGQKAKQFQTKLEDGDEQQLMARVTGNYKRGNER